MRNDLIRLQGEYQKKSATREATRFPNAAEFSHNFYLATFQPRSLLIHPTECALLSQQEEYSTYNRICLSLPSECQEVNGISRRQFPATRRGARVFVNTLLIVQPHDKTSSPSAQN